MRDMVMDIELDPHQTIMEAAEGSHPSQDIGSAIYISCSSDPPLGGIQLNGSADSTMLDGLPGL